MAVTFYEFFRFMELTRNNLLEIVIHHHAHTLQHLHLRLAALGHGGARQSREGAVFLQRLLGLRGAGHGGRGGADGCVAAHHALPRRAGLLLRLALRARADAGHGARLPGGVLRHGVHGGKAQRRHADHHRRGRGDRHTGQLRRHIRRAPYTRARC